MESEEIAHARAGDFTKDRKARWEQWICATCEARLTDTPEAMYGIMLVPVDLQERGEKIHRIVCAHQRAAHGKDCEGHPIAEGGGACDRPPPGWWCSRAKGHEGPCAALPVEG